VLLTLLAWATSLFGLALLAADAGPWLSLAVGLCLGYGGVGTLAARAVPAPAEARLGLRGFAPRFGLPIVLLLPAIVLGSEIDNWVRPLFPALPVPKEAEALPSEEVLRLVTLEYVIVQALIRPVLEEFFFRGVMQQGLIAHLGAVAGVVQTALLAGLASGGLALPFGGAGLAASSAARGAFLGLALGLLRHASGSLLAPIVAAVLLESAAIALGTGLAADLPIAGFNAPGDHTPLAILAASALPVAAAITLALRWRCRGDVPPR
jgi:membrane protease YdiL (CAAX protease family)